MESGRPATTDRLGRIWADNVLDPASENSIRFGFVAGEGLLGELWEAIAKLEKAAADEAYFQEPSYHRRLQEARLAVFKVIERIGTASQQTLEREVGQGMLVRTPMTPAEIEAEIRKYEERFDMTTEEMLAAEKLPDEFGMMDWKILVRYREGKNE